MFIIACNLEISKKVMKFVKYPIRKLLNSYTQFICRKEFENQSFKRFNERAVEFSFVFKHLAQICPKKVLDVGTGTTALPHLIRNCGNLVHAVDNVKDYWPAGMVNRHYHVISDDITASKLDEKFDLITCISVLEHIKQSDAAVKNMFDLLNPNGFLLITFPYCEQKYVEDVYQLEGSTYGKGRAYVCQAYSRNNIDGWLKASNGTIIEQEYWKFWDGDFWTVGNQIIPPVKTNSEGKHQITCLLMQKKG